MKKGIIIKAALILACVSIPLGAKQTLDSSKGVTPSTPPDAEFSLRQLERKKSEFLDVTKIKTQLLKQAMSCAEVAANLQELRDCDSSLKSKFQSLDGQLKGARDKR